MKEGWVVKPLGDVVDLIMGQAPPSGDCNFSGVGVPFVKVGEFGVSRPLIREWTSNPLRMALATDVLICVVGATCGKINLGADCAIGRSVAAIRPNPDAIEQYFLYYFMMTLVERLRSGSSGAAQTVISKEMIRSVLMPVPPSSEQKRIIAKLDEAFESIASAKEKAEQNLLNARALFDSYLDGVFFNRGEGWVERSLVDLTTKIGSGATPLGGQDSYKADGISLIRSLNVHDGGFRYEKLAFLDEEQAKGLANVTIEQNDVLLNITGASVARCCVVPIDVLPARVNQHVSIIRAKPNLISYEFLHYALISRSHKKTLLKIGDEGGSTRQAITKAQLQEYGLSYPAELSAQKEITDRVNLIREQTQALESLYQQKLNALDELKQSLLHQAFSGEL